MRLRDLVEMHNMQEGPRIGWYRRRPSVLGGGLRETAHRFSFVEWALI